jgi:hypothetical protein
MEGGRLKFVSVSYFKLKRIFGPKDSNKKNAVFQDLKKMNFSIPLSGFLKYDKLLLTEQLLD